MSGIKTSIVMKDYVKAILFILLISLLDILFRKGLVVNFIPINLPSQMSGFVLYTLFMLAALIVTKRFCAIDKEGLAEYGIDLTSRNRRDFSLGLLIGILLWGLVSLSQALIAGFTWEIRADWSLFNILYGLIFILIADIGTELYYRGYGLSKFAKSFGAHMAIIIMTLFVGLRSYSTEMDGELLFYAMIIPALHTLFFCIIYFKTKRLGAAVGIHTGANFVTISVFDLRPFQDGQTIPSGLLKPNVELENLELQSLQLPWIILAILFSVALYFWWRKGKSSLSEI